MLNSRPGPTVRGMTPEDSMSDAVAWLDEYIEVPTLIERARVTARFIELWTERFARAG